MSVPCPELSLHQVEVPVEVAPGASLVVEASDGEVTGTAAMPFGTWGQRLERGELFAPTREAVEDAVGRALGYPVSLGYWLAGADVLDLRFYHLPKSVEARALEAIQAARVRVERCRGVVAENQEVLKASKGDLEAAQLDLEDTIKSYDPAQAPLVEFGERQSAEDAWKSVPIRQALLGLSTKVYEAFAQAGIGTMGDFREWCHDHVLEQLPGVGEGKAEKILEAQEAFWARQGRKPGEEGDPHGS